MIRRIILLATSVGLAMASEITSATTIDLVEYAFNIDGVISNPTLGDSVPGGVDLSGFDTGTGLGIISVELFGAGARYASVFVDQEIDEPTNTYFNENGATAGTAATGETWEIDEPEHVFGDIYTNFENSALDNSTAVSAGLEDDVSMALAWDFSLAAGEIASIDFILSDTVPTSGFYLTQTDPDSDVSIYFRSTLDISGPTVVPLPATAWLFGSAMAGAIALGRRKRERSRA
jgi:hypothetical protein